MKKSKFDNRKISIKSSKQEIKQITQFEGYNVSRSPIGRNNQIKAHRSHSYKNFSQRDESLNLIREKALLEQEREDIMKTREDLITQVELIQKEKNEVIEAKDQEIEKLKEELQRLKSQSHTGNKSILDTAEDSLQKPPSHSNNNSDKLCHLNKKVANLERQLRNRNKDYLFALKELEKIKLSTGSNKINSLEDIELD